jgi:hypothetical protein
MFLDFTIKLIYQFSLKLREKKLIIIIAQETKIQLKNQW